MQPQERIVIQSMQPVRIIGSPKALSVEEGYAEISVELDHEPDSDFSYWFAHPNEAATGYTWNSGFHPIMCRVAGKIIHFKTRVNALEGNYKLLNEWIATANSYSRKVASKREQELQRRRIQEEEAERNRQELQKRLNQL